MHDRSGSEADALYVTRPFLPPLHEFLPYLDDIWRSAQLTNNGEYHRRFEVALARYLDVEHVSLVANGTLGLLTALKALELGGEVITTPFSFVATAHALLWNGLTPVFADIDPQTLNLDPAAVAAAVTPRTSAILPVHVFGRPCDTAAIDRIAAERGLRVLYDAAHAFGVRGRHAGLLRAGDLSVLSFHATKVFHTFEGGAVVCGDAALKRRIDYLRNFGFQDETTVLTLGINAKLNELQSAFGLLHLQHMDEVMARRQAVDSHYRLALREVRGIRCLELPQAASSNFGYFPILVGDEFAASRDALYAALRGAGIFARRYFFPLISDFPMYRHLPSADPARLPVARSVAARVLCLPIHAAMTAADCDRVAATMRACAQRLTR